MIRHLTTVSLVNVLSQVFHAIHVAEGIWAKYGADTLWVTSVHDGTHKAGSLHYDGFAADLRVKNLAEKVWRLAADELSAALGPEYDVLLETDPKAGPHVHVEFDPLHSNPKKETSA